jgi:hypothetical protein
MVAQLSDLLPELVDISDQSTGQLHLVSKASNVITILHRQHYSISSFMGSAQEVAVLGMLHLVILIMMQRGQSFSCGISYSSLECPPRGDSLNHMADTISRRLLIYDHPYVPEIGVLSKQPWGSNEERGLTMTQCQE